MPVLPLAAPLPGPSGLCSLVMLLSPPMWGSRGDRRGVTLRTALGPVCMRTQEWAGVQGGEKEGKILEALLGLARAGPLPSLPSGCPTLPRTSSVRGSPVCRDGENPSVTRLPSPLSVHRSPPQGVSDSQT